MEAVREGGHGVLPEPPHVPGRRVERLRDLGVPEPVEDREGDRLLVQRAQERPGGGDVDLVGDQVGQVADVHHRLELVWADGGYTGSLVEYCLATLTLVLAIVKRSDDQKGFVVLPKRWIVERLFAHLMRSRRLVRDFERRTTSAEAMIYWSMTLLMTRRLARSRLPRG